MIIENFLQKLGISAAISEIVALIVIISVIGVVYALFVGRFRLDNALINIYMSMAVVSVLPKYITRLFDNVEIVIFLLIIAIFTIAGDNLFDIHISGSGLRIWKLFVMSFLEVGLILSVVSVLLPSRIVLDYISIGAYGYLTSENAKFFWTAAPLAFLLFINKKD